MIYRFWISVSLLHLVLVPGSCSRPNISGHTGTTSISTSCICAYYAEAVRRYIGASGEARPGVWRRQGWIRSELLAPAGRRPLNAGSKGEAKGQKEHTGGAERQRQSGTGMYA